MNDMRHERCSAVARCCDKILKSKKMMCKDFRGVVIFYSSQQVLSLDQLPYSSSQLQVAESESWKGLKWVSFNVIWGMTENVQLVHD